MEFHIDIQHAADALIPFSDETITQWALLALSQEQASGELTIRLVNEKEITELNHTYRMKNNPTNVLAFPANLPDDVKLDSPFFGDVIICPTVLKKESEAYSNSLEAHWAHIVIHGVLHLLGYDHITDEDASIMQPIESKLLIQLGFSDPYEEGSDE